MELRRKQLVVIVTCLAIIGAIFTAIPFISSMNPTSEISDYARELDISKIRPNSSRLFQIRKSKKVEEPTSTSWYSGLALFVVRDNSGKFYLYSLPTWEGKVIMPYKQWGQHDGYCPDLEVRISNKKEAIIQCGSPDYAEFLTKQWYWSINGENLGEDLPDLVKVQFRVSSGVMYAFIR